MLLGAHLIAGAVVGEAMENPYLAFLAGIIMHFILDAVPHYDTTDNGSITLRQIALVAIDTLLGLIILIFCYQDFSIHKTAFLAGALGGIFPDLLDNVPLWKMAFRRTRFGKKFNKLHGWLQKYKPSILFGLLFQYIIIAISVFILFRMK